jgi:ABC-type multidrug transport system permease subunit
MKVETWIFAGCSAFFLLVAPAYWFITSEVIGTTALTMTLLLTSLITFYLGFSSRRIPPRPEDRKDAEVADGAGELGFFPPYSWWPLWCAITLAVIVLALALQLFWMAIIGGIFGAAALSGWIFEYYVGEHAH